MSNLIVGWGITGKSITNFFEDNNMNDYKIWDDYITDTISDKIEDDPSNVTIDNYSKVYVSPGVPPDHQLILQSDNNLNKIPIETDLDIFFDTNKDLSIKVIGITGTNGKSTCAELLKEVLIDSGYKVEICGNVGYPILDLKNIEDYDYLILELSSFQLHYVKRLKLDIAAIVNITEDHIDWHGNKLEYQKSKLAISRHTSGAQKTILGALPEQIIPDIDMNNYSLITKATSDRNGISKDIQNVIYGICDLLSIEEDPIETVFDKNRINPHRFEIFGKYAELTFINDSKATNFSAVTSALDKVECGLLIMHGDLKGVNPDYLIIPEGIHSVVFYGDNQLEPALDTKNIFYIESFTELPEIINSVCKKGDTVILSPGGSSFEHFNDYRHRGDEFKNSIRKAYLQDSGAK